MTHGDPSPRSPYEVLRDKRNYRFIDSRATGMSITLTVLCHATEQYWQTCYGIGISSDRLPAQWCQVEPVQVTRTEWREVRT